MLVSLDVSSVPARPAGAGRYVVELARGLASASVAASTGAGANVRPTFIARRDDALRWSAIPGGSTSASAPSARPLRLLWEQTRLPTLLRAMEVDVHHGPHYTMPERSSVPTVVTIHDMTFFDNPEWHERTKVFVFRRAIEQAVARATRLIAVSTHTAEQVRQRFGDIAVTVIPHGIDHDRFHPDAVDGEQAALRSAGLPEHYIAFVGTIEPRKNLVRLIHAFDHLAEDNPLLHLVIAGQRGWQLEEFDSALAASAHRNRIVVPGYLDEALVPALLRHARSVAYPSHFEGFGLPALEALACGVPVVAGRGSAMEEVVGGAGILVDSGDVDAIAEGLREALSTDRNSAVGRGVEAAARFTWDAAVRAHIDVYEAAAKSV